MRNSWRVATLLGLAWWGAAAVPARAEDENAMPPGTATTVRVSASESTNVADRNVVLLRFMEKDDAEEDLQLTPPKLGDASPIPDDSGPELECGGVSSRRTARAMAIPTVEPEDKADDAPVTKSQAPSSGASRMSPRMTSLRDRVRELLGYYHTKRLNTRDHNPWEVMHSIVAYGVESQLDRNGPGGPIVNSISWLCWNGDCHGVSILDLTNGRVTAKKGPQVQGHPGQLLAILAQGSVATECPIKVGNKRFTLADLIESEKRDCKADTELTFRLIAFSHYLDIDARWKNTDGETWTIDRLVHEELAQPIVGAACGGTHRLMGLSYAIRKRQNSGLPMTGEFARAKKFVEDYHRYTLTRLQNPDGSFSTEWFRAPGARPDLNRRIQTTGHILEWLAYSLPFDALEDPRVVQAVEYLTGVLEEKRDGEIGPLGHAVHSLAIYDARVFKPRDDGSAPPPLVADSHAVPVKPGVSEPVPTAAANPPRTATRWNHSHRGNNEGSKNNPGNNGSSKTGNSGLHNSSTSNNGLPSNGASSDGLPNRGNSSSGASSNAASNNGSSNGLPNKGTAGNNNNNGIFDQAFGNKSSTGTGTNSNNSKSGTPNNGTAQGSTSKNTTSSNRPTPPAPPPASSRRTAQP